MSLLDEEPPRSDDGLRGTSLPADDDDHNTEHARPRKRTRRACDKCSTSRTRCDGECPCRRCQDYGYTCRYNREVKKRGRVPISATSTTPRPEATARRESQPEKSPNGDVHPRVSPSLPSPDLSLPATHFVSTLPRGPSVTDLSIMVQSPVLPGPPGHDRAHAPYVVSQGYAAHHHAPLQLAPLLEQPPLPSHMRRDSHNSHGSPPGIALMSGSDSSVGYPSPNNAIMGLPPAPSGPAAAGAVQNRHARHSFGAAAAAAATTVPPPPTNGAVHRASFGAAATAVMGPSAATLSELQRIDSLYQAPSSDCRYRFLDPVLPYLRDIMPPSVAADLLDVYLTEPGSSLFRCASPYVLTRIFRKKSVLDPVHPRPTTPALMATMLWCAAQTADIVLLHVPGSRSKMTNALYELATSLISERDPDRWRRIHGGLRVETEQPQPYPPASSVPTTTETNEPAGLVDDVLTFILLSITVSGGDFKSDCFKWWSKAVRLATALKLNREDERCPAAVSPCANPLCSCRRDPEAESLAHAEAREERRRVFWLLYCLDRHLSLSFNTVLGIPDSYCEVYAPLPEPIWEHLDEIPPQELPPRVLGPPTIITGTGFFEYFLPLMAIMGDIIDVHHRRQHPRLGGLDDDPAVAVISDLLAECEQSIEKLSQEPEEPPPPPSHQPVPSGGPSIKDLVTNGPPPSSAAVDTAVPATGPPPLSHQQRQKQQQQQQPQQPPASSQTTTTTTTTTTATATATATAAKTQSQRQLVTAYSTHILHVLHVLLHGKWDAISMLDDDDDWITSARFNACASHAVAASQAVSRILLLDPELTFMPYLFGIYLLHGSFILLLFADRMPQLGPNQSVEQACETIIRAHEVCVVTLSTEFQKNFRKVLRSTLYSVRGSSPTEWEEHKARRRALSLYRWTRGARGLAL